jgi:hypothetical protein
MSTGFPLCEADRLFSTIRSAHLVMIGEASLTAAAEKIGRMDFARGALRSKERVEKIEGCPSMSKLL